MVPTRGVVGAVTRPVEGIDPGRPRAWHDPRYTSRDGTEGVSPFPHGFPHQPARVNEPILDQRVSTTNREHPELLTPGAIPNNTQEQVSGPSFWDRHPLRPPLHQTIPPPLPRLPPRPPTSWVTRDVTEVQRNKRSSGSHLALQVRRPDITSAQGGAQDVSRHHVRPARLPLTEIPSLPTRYYLPECALPAHIALISVKLYVADTMFPRAICCK